MSRLLSSTSDVENPTLMERKYRPSYFIFYRRTIAMVFFALNLRSIILSVYRAHVRESVCAKNMFDHLRNTILRQRR